MLRLTLPALTACMLHDECERRVSSSRARLHDRRRGGVGAVPDLYLTGNRQCPARP
jgi:hypothetical protein